ncbi:hypothetical protein D6D54_08950 [Spiroplasma poulsonii]|uniref:Uncharacterized protein n=2 Tax=Spiroplasma poulsonii TaxID=2138 RepID=A0A433ELJ5_9MOLU|nr:hypothetical protein D6D54_08950 [Spiroplasma poulsonii]
MTTNYKTSFLLPHDYEIPTFNYPQYVLPPVPYNYQVYTKYIWDGKTGQALITKITAPAQCKKGTKANEYINLFSDEFNEGYYETEIDLRQIDPTIQSIEKFKSVYKTIEISNLNNLQVRCFKPEIEQFIKDRNVNLTIGRLETCAFSFGLLSNITLQKSGLEQKDNITFEKKIIYTDEIKVNDIQTFLTGTTNGLPSRNYPNRYITESGTGDINFLLQITKLSDSIINKIKETYIQAYYTNELKLKIRFSKVLFAQLLLRNIDSGFDRYNAGNDKDITIDLNALGVLGMINNSDNPIKIIITPK